jgi:hypothetical protein
MLQLTTHYFYQRETMIISDLDYLDSILETDAIHLNGGSAVANSTAWAVASGSSTATSILFQNLAISNPNGSLAASSVRSSAKATGGNAFSAAFSSASASSSG